MLNEELYVPVRDEVLAFLLRKHKIAGNDVVFQGIRKVRLMRDLARSQQEDVLVRMAEEGWLERRRSGATWSLRADMVAKARALVTAEQVADESLDEAELDERDESSVPSDVLKRIEHAVSRAEAAEALARRLQDQVSEVSKRHPAVAAPPVDSSGLERRVRELGERVDSLNGKVSTLSSKQGDSGVKASIMGEVSALRKDLEALSSSVREAGARAAFAGITSGTVAGYAAMFRAFLAREGLGDDDTLGEVMRVALMAPTEGVLQARSPDVSYTWVPGLVMPGKCVVCAEDMGTEAAGVIPVLSKSGPPGPVVYAPWLATVHPRHGVVALVDENVGVKEDDSGHQIFEKVRSHEALKYVMNQVRAANKGARSVHFFVFEKTDGSPGEVARVIRENTAKILVGGGAMRGVESSVGESEQTRELSEYAQRLQAVKEMAGAGSPNGVAKILAEATVEEKRAKD